MVLLSTHNIYFALEIRTNIFNYAILLKGLSKVKISKYFCCKIVISFLSIGLLKRIVSFIFHTVYAPFLVSKRRPHDHVLRFCICIYQETKTQSLICYHACMLQTQLIELRIYEIMN